MRAWPEPGRFPHHPPLLHCPPSLPTFTSLVQPPDAGRVWQLRHWLRYVDSPGRDGMRSGWQGREGGKHTSQRPLWARLRAMGVALPPLRGWPPGALNVIFLKPAASLPRLAIPVYMSPGSTRLGPRSRPPRYTFYSTQHPDPPKLGLRLKINNEPPKLAAVGAAAAPHRRTRPSQAQEEAPEGGKTADADDGQGLAWSPRCPRTQSPLRGQAPPGTRQFAPQGSGSSG